MADKGKKRKLPKSTEGVDSRQQQHSTSKSAKTKKASKSSENMENFISSLVRKVSGPFENLQSTKTQRMQKRAAKQQRRKERKEGKVENTRVASQKTTQQQTSQHKLEDTQKWTTTHKNRKRLRNTAGVVKDILKEMNQNDQEQACSRKFQKPFHGFETTKKKKKSKKWDDENIQPRLKDYGGLGLALPSLFLSFEDPSFTRRLEDEFQEHIDGFFGKQRTKAMKKQLDGDMLWRKMEKIKKDNQKVEGKKMSDMTPDQRVEAMLKAGLL